MSQPRQIVPGATYLLTRRALRRHMLFRPDAVITQLVLYTLAVSARRYGLHVHALCLMSTHHPGSLTYRAAENLANFLALGHHGAHGSRHRPAPAPSPAS